MRKQTHKNDKMNHSIKQIKFTGKSRNKKTKNVERNHLMHQVKLSKP